MTCKEFWNAETDHPEHLKECPGCAARFARQQELAAGLHTLGAQMKRVQAPERVERVLVAAFRGQTAVGGRPVGRGSWWLAGAWAAALAATALLAISLARPHEPQRTRRTVRSRTQLAMVVEPPDLTAEGEFLTLPNAAAVDPNEEVDLVRVELPRSAMIPLGFAVPAERASETVEADVMLDADGVARAVRFVNSDETKEISW
jgi:hypothetical protein